MTPEHEGWGPALLIEQQQGERAPVYVAEGIGSLVLARDEAGVERFRRIAVYLDVLRQGTEARSC